jgi:hypothetical protein
MVGTPAKIFFSPGVQTWFGEAQLNVCCLGLAPGSALKQTCDLSLFDLVWTGDVIASFHLAEGRYGVGWIDIEVNFAPLQALVPKTSREGSEEREREREVSSPWTHADFIHLRLI